MIHLLRFALGLSAGLALCAACGDDERAPPRPCDPAAANTCGEELVCALQPDGGGLCQIPPGGRCDPDASNPNCRVGSACFAPPGSADAGAGGGEAVCLVLEAGECDPLAPFCAEMLTCAELEDGSHRCYAPLLVRGTVTDAADRSGIEGAHVIALDGESVAATDVAVSTAPDGAYVLELPVVRDMEGRPLATSYTLRASAAAYQTFPGGLRTAIPLNSTDAIETEEGWILEGTVTEITLIAIVDDGIARHTVSGQLRSVDDSEAPEVLAALAGVLIVADGGETVSAVTDRAGNFTLFNVPDGSFDLAGYAVGVAVEREQVQVAGADVDDVVLHATIGSLATVTGNVQIVNATGGLVTSIVLMVEDTFDDVFVRGEVPRGLRAPRSGAPDVSGAFTIADVPDGNYVVLAAFENDDLVRDPDTNIAGTDIVHIMVSGADVALSESFKITQALEVFGPGVDDPEAVQTVPTLRWADDSSEDWYEVRVFDAFGELVWSDENVPSVSGSTEVSLVYGGPLDVGMYYQFRVTSWRQPGGGSAAPISATEDLRGVFYVVP